MNEQEEAFLYSPPYNGTTMSTTPKREKIQPGDLLAYKALLLGIASEAVASSTQPMGEVHRRVKIDTMKWLKDLSKQAFAEASEEAGRKP
jgi:hypothetical protein